MLSPGSIQTRIFLLERLVVSLGYFFSTSSNQLLPSVFYSISKCTTHEDLLTIANRHIKFRIAYSGDSFGYTPAEPNCFHYEYFCKVIASVFVNSTRDELLDMNNRISISENTDLIYTLCCCIPADKEKVSLPHIWYSSKDILRSQFTVSSYENESVERICITEQPDIQKLPKEIIQMMDEVCEAYNIHDVELPSKRIEIISHNKIKKHVITAAFAVTFLLSSFALFGGVFPNVFSAFHFPYLFGRSFLAYTIAFAIVSGASLIISCFRIFGPLELRMKLCNSNNPAAKLFSCIFVGQDDLPERNKEIDQEI
jgi:hypothetical protein